MSTFRNEYRWVLVVALVIVLFASVPLFVGYGSQTADQRFVGAIYDRQDYSVHLAMMHYGAAGGWDYQLRFTTEQHTATYLKTFYVALGHLTGWMGVQLDVVFHVVGALLGLLVCLLIYRLLTRIFPGVNQRRFALVLIICGSGFGWIQIPFGLLPDPKIWPIDVWLIDAYIFFSIALFPHFSALIAALVLALTAFLDHLEQPRWRHIAIMAACALFVQMVNPVVFGLADIAMLGAFVFSCWQKRSFNRLSALTLGLLAIIQLPLLAYSYNLLTRDPSWAVFTTQNATPSPPPIYLLLGYGLFWPFAVLGAINAFRRPSAGSGLAVFWAVATFTLAYLPLAIQRRFLLAATIPLGILAMPTIFEFSAWLGNRVSIRKSTGAVMIVMLTSLGSLFLVALYSINISARPANLFEPLALVQAVDWLGKHGGANDVVLASEPTAQLVAMRTPLRLYFGHEMETLYFDAKQSQVKSFYSGLQPQSWLAGLPINWVVYGPHEKELGTVAPAGPDLKIVYQNDSVTIYKVTPP